MTNQNYDSQSTKALLSAFADGEMNADDQLSDSEIAELACADQEAMAAWQSIHLTRDVLQNEYHSALDSDFASKLSEKIYTEEETLQSTVVAMDQARDRLRSADVNQRSGVEKTPGNSSAKVVTMAIFKPVAGLGLAASLAGGAFLFSQLWNENNGLVGKSDQTVATAPAEPSLNVPALNQNDIQQVAVGSTRSIGVDNAGTRWRSESSQRNKQVEQRLNALLTNHLEDASMGRVHGGMLSHSRVVSYDSMPEKEEAQ